MRRPLRRRWLVRHHASLGGVVHGVVVTILSDIGGGGGVFAAKLAVQNVERENARFARGSAQGDLFAENIIGDDFLLAEERDEDSPFLGEALALLHVELVLVSQAAHEAPARAGNLCRVERREALVFGDTRFDGAQIREPAGAAQLAPAAADPVETPRFVADANVPHLHARAEFAFELADEVAKVDTRFGGEVDGEPSAVELPLGVRDLHVELLRSCFFDRASAHGVFVFAQQTGAFNLLAVGEAHGGAEWPRRFFAVRGAGLPSRGEFASGVHATEVFATVGFDDDPGFLGGWFVERPVKELPPVAFEGHFNQLRHRIRLKGLTRCTGRCARTSRADGVRVCRA